MSGRVRGQVPPNDAVPTIDADVAFVAEGGIAMSIGVVSSSLGFALESSIV
ncbi:MAG: hypothetical protein AAF183_19850 [Pseudomonadota bacterium]